MLTWFTTVGVCRFSPPLGRDGSTSRRDGKTTEWWMIVECDRGIGALFRALYYAHSHRIRSLNEPLWGTHVSIIRDEQPTIMDDWKSLDGKPVEIKYTNRVEFHSGYAVVPAECDALLDYRSSLGLPRQPEFPLHMTIGNLKPQS